MQVGKLPDAGSLRWSGRAAIAAVAALSMALVGCEIKETDFTYYELGEKHLINNNATQAAKDFLKSIDKEERTRSKARAYLAVSYDQAAKKMKNIPSEAKKYAALRDKAINEVRQDPAAVQGMVRILSRQDFLAESAENALVVLGEDCVQNLIVSYHKPLMRRKVQRVLERIGPKAGAGLKEAIQSDSYDALEKSELLRILGHVTDAQSIPFLKSLRENEAASAGLRTEASAALYNLGEKGERNFILNNLESTDLLARRAAAHALQFLDRKPPASKIVERLSDEDEIVRLSIVQAVQKHGNGRSTINALVDALQKETNNAVVDKMVDTVAGFETSAIAPTLSALMKTQENDHWRRRQRLSRIIGHEQVIWKLSENQLYDLDEFYRKETSPQVQSILADILNKIYEKEKGGN